MHIKTVLTQHRLHTTFWTLCRPPRFANDILIAHAEAAEMRTWVSKNTLLNYPVLVGADPAAFNYATLSRAAWPLWQNSHGCWACGSVGR